MKHMVVGLLSMTLLLPSAAFADETNVRVLEMLNDLGGPAKMKKYNGKVRKCVDGGTKKVTVKSSGAGTTYHGVYKSCKEGSSLRNGEVKITAAARSAEEKSTSGNRQGAKAVLDFVTTDNCTKSQDEYLYLGFYSQDKSYHWGPFYLQYDGIPLHTELSCRKGETVCMGAWTSTKDRFWGCGDNCREETEECYVCDDTAVNISFECADRGSDEDAPAPQSP